MKVLLVNGSPWNDGNVHLSLKECGKAIEEAGIETEYFHIGSKPVRGCLGCDRCRELGKCIFDDDILNELVSRMKEADGYVFATPVYYSSPNGALISLLDRAFYSSSAFFKHKPAAAIAVCRRTGGSASVDCLLKYFTINEMPVASALYWPVIHGSEKGEAASDHEGLQIMRSLGANMAFLVKELAGKKREFNEKREFTNFIR